MVNRHFSVPGALVRARKALGLSLRRAAERAGTSHATLAAYESGRKSPGLNTYLRILTSYGLAAEVRLSARIREVDGYPRGEELEEVLALAEQFPARHAKKLAYPRFGTQ